MFVIKLCMEMSGFGNISSDFFKIRDYGTQV